MKVLLLGLGILGSAMSITAGLVNAGNMEAVDLSGYRWQKRLLLIFTPAVDFLAYQTLIGQLHQNRAGVVDRDLLVFRLVNRGQSQLGEAELNPRRAETLRLRFGVREDEFWVVLIGKDGGVKLSTDSVELADIFSLIDNMPLRQQERQEKRR